MSKKLSIVIPCYNEAENIPMLFEKLRNIERDDIEFVIVNNGSVDNSAEVLKNETENLNPENYKIVNVEKNQGYGFGILSGLKECSGDILSWTHADLQTDVADLITALNLYEKFNDSSVLIKGERKKRKLSETFFTFGMQIASFLIIKTYLTDINAQPKLFSREFYSAYIKDKAPYDFSLDLYVLYMAKKHGRIEKFPVYFTQRLHGEAKGGSGSSFSTRMKLIKRTFKFMFELKKNLKNG